MFRNHDSSDDKSNEPQVTADSSYSDHVTYTTNINNNQQEQYTIVLHHKLSGRSGSYNIAPTQNSVIVYKQLSSEYKFETLAFGIVPFWSKPLGTSSEAQTKQLHRDQSKHFNCRRETLFQGSSLWSSVKKQRCVVPIEGYFEWQKKGNDKVPFYISSSKHSLLFLAGFYSHNTSYQHNYQPNSDYLSSFTIITGPAEKSDQLDLSWLHARKPLMLDPGTQEWEDWLNPDLETSDDLLTKCLESNRSKAYSTIVSHVVSKEVGKVSSNGEHLIKEVKKERGLDSFFTKKRSHDEENDVNKKVKTE